MAHGASRLDFSAEDWDVAREIYDGCWVIATRHRAGTIEGMEVNNRSFVFRLKHGADDVLVVFGVAGPTAVKAVQQLAERTGLPVAWVLSNGGAHHMFLRLWYRAFPDARIPVPAKRIPFTRNGENLSEEFADRWELLEGPRPEAFLEAFGDQVDLAIFDQLLAYSDQTSADAFGGGALDHTSEPIRLSGLQIMMRMNGLMSDRSQPTEEVFLFHRASGLVVAGHNFPFSYVPKGHRPEPRLALGAPPFPLNWLMRIMTPPGAFTSLLESQPQPIADPAKHIETWEHVLAWDIEAWTTTHDPPGVGGPDWTGDAIKQAIRKSLARTGEDDPSGARLKWNRKRNG